MRQSRPLRAALYRSVLAVIIASTTVLSGVSFDGSHVSFEPQSAAAISCNGTHEYRTVPGARQTGVATGVRGSISWTNPTVCQLQPNDGFVAHSVTLCPSGACGG